MAPLDIRVGWYGQLSRDISRRHWSWFFHLRSREEKLRWLKVAAEGGMAKAQYQFYQLELPDQQVYLL